VDDISQSRLQLVYPPLAAKIAALFALVESGGEEIRVVQGLRTWAEQDALYAQGRSTAGEIVTNVKGGYSYHCFGLAADCAPSLYGPDRPYDPDWNSSHFAWKDMEAKGVSLGLVSGADWCSLPDAPHFQMTGRFPIDEPNDEVRSLFAQGGLPAVWNAISNQEATS
jgi:peptidoglycan LD-endopeptidase CwlK